MQPTETPPARRSRTARIRSGLASNEVPVLLGAVVVVVLIVAATLAAVKPRRDDSTEPIGPCEVVAATGELSRAAAAEKQGSGVRCIPDAELKIVLRHDLRDALAGAGYTDEVYAASLEHQTVPAPIWRFLQVSEGSDHLYLTAISTPAAGSIDLHSIHLDVSRQGGVEAVVRTGPPAEVSEAEWADGAEAAADHGGLPYRVDDATVPIGLSPVEVPDVEGRYIYAGAVQASDGGPVWFVAPGDFGLYLAEVVPVG